jgi:hypothetical protein
VACTPATAIQAGLSGGGERVGQLGDEPIQVVAGDASKDRMRQGRAGLFDRHNQQTVRPATLSIKLTADHINTPLLSPVCYFADSVDHGCREGGSVGSARPAELV